ncbi:polynucleotide 5'-hydroxyl-kinase NOL9 [Periophthalmus magnuspinnatus]|uniref:polynucleotide 5'-hydroxyl-kinase NOL9 n=1 Tax=Periophthalmus magnuspinnatus TaxID=409849 RepID=UPI00145AC1E8|nr:polynucleotide 5'-hydroxyl-kinase NOL9 [Periophthalmus magnuspinnatus]XP_055079080.1 polynucleotide 5'-hydroxyl-kinase NOL9 [Periophthalmus magnuspinnatus]
MKVKRSSHGKGHGKSQKWRDARTKRCRPTAVTSSDLNSTPAMAQLINEHQVLGKKKPNIKRLETKPKSVSDSKKTGPQKFFAHTNGNSSSAVEEAEEMEQNSFSGFGHHGNGLEFVGDKQFFKPGRLEGNALHHCAVRDDKKNHAVVVMQKDQTLCFRGKCFLTCLYGRVEVMGFTIEEGQQPYPLFSPASHSPITVRAMETENTHFSEDSAQLADILRDYLTSGSRKKLAGKVIRDSSIILLEPMESTLTRFLASFPDLNELFSPPVSELLSAVLDTPLNGLGIIPLSNNIEGITSSTSLKNVLNTLVNACKGDMDGTVILVCGAKNVGKSTFIQMLINTLLNHTGSVEYLEGDLGQTEFTPAGCVCLTTVTEPLLGPPFTHQRTPEHMIYYGESSCESDLDRYLEALKSLWHSQPQSREGPVIINTMGWVKGFGLQLLVDMLRFFPVSHVVQLGYGGIQQCPSLTPDYLRTAQGYQTHPPPQSALDEFAESSTPPRTFVHLPVQSEFKGVGTQGKAKHQRSNEMRELSLLAYLSQLQSPDPGPVRPLHSLTPYQVPHSAVALGVLHCEVMPSHMFYAANASLVALCCLREKVTSRGSPVLLPQAPLCPCVGFGILRGIDVVRGLYYLLTPVDPSVLRSVNCLLVGAISLPSCIVKTQGCDEDTPYITSNYSFDLTGAGKLKIFKGMLRPGQERH